MPVADKPDSQEICFVPDGDYARFVEQRLPDAGPGGVITDPAGHVLGRHDGVHRYTVGQRKGLRLSSTDAALRARDPAGLADRRGGRPAALERVACDVADVNWIGGAAAARLRFASGCRSGIATSRPPLSLRRTRRGRATVAFEEPQRAVTPGQAAVFYDGDEVVGGGWIGRNYASVTVRSGRVLLCLRRRRRARWRCSRNRSASMAAMHPTQPR